MQNRIKEILADRKFNASTLAEEGEWSQETVARRAGISVFTFNRIANGKQSCGKRLQKAIAKALRRRVEEVFPPPTSKRATRVG